jgi:signal transduction histidine kinase
MISKMKNLFDKLIIFIVCLVLYVPSVNNIYMIAPILVTIILSAVLSFFEDKRITLSVFTIFIFTCFLKPEFIFFSPLICYDTVFLGKQWSPGNQWFLGNQWIWVLSFLPLAVNYTQPLLASKWMIAAFILIAYILKHRTVSLQNMEKDYFRLRDSAKDISIKLEKQNKEILEKQDYEINLATLNERNRIARDIHDNVGHLLSRSILQIGALLAINKDEGTKESLNLVKETLTEAMNSIRASVHDLHEESIDLQTEIQKLTDNFKFCPIKFDYDIDTSLDKNVKYCFIAVTKEALSNIIKHSNASNVSVTIREHPALYQLVIQDNGSSCRYSSENGIGIKNITDRVDSLGGNVNINTDKGFRIFISIPKVQAL